MKEKWNLRLQEEMRHFRHRQKLGQLDWLVEDGYLISIFIGDT